MRHVRTVLHYRKRKSGRANIVVQVAVVMTTLLQITRQNIELLDQESGKRLRRYIRAVRIEIDESLSATKARREQDQEVR